MSYEDTNRLIKEIAELKEQNKNICKSLLQLGKMIAMQNSVGYGEDVYLKVVDQMKLLAGEKVVDYDDDEY